MDSRGEVRMTVGGLSKRVRYISLRKSSDVRVRLYWDKNLIEALKTKNQRIHYGLIQLIMFCLYINLSHKFQRQVSEKGSLIRQRRGLQ